MDFELGSHPENDMKFDGAIQQITPGPVGGSFVPGFAGEFGKFQEITIKRKPQRKQKISCFVYTL